MGNYNDDNILSASVITNFISSPMEMTRKLAAEYYQSRLI
jgi:hypothetical protein